MASCHLSYIEKKKVFKNIVTTHKIEQNTYLGS